MNPPSKPLTTSGRATAAFTSLGVFICVLVALDSVAGTYTYAGKTHASTVNPSKSNAWNSVVSWTGGPAAFPNAVGDVAVTPGNVGGDVALYLNQDITIGDFSWIGNVLELYPGAPAGKFIVDNNGAASQWSFYTPYWCWLDVDMVLNNNLTISNTTTIGASEPVRINGVISGPGKLTLDWNGTSTHTLYLGVQDSAALNTYSGGTRLQGHSTTGWLFQPRKNGAFGTGNVELNGYAKLILADRGTTDNYIADSASLYLETVNQTNYAQMVLSNNMVETISSLYIDGVQQPVGTYGATGSGATELLDDFISGGGRLVVTNGAPSPGAINNLPPSNVTAASATINGQLVSIGATPTEVWFYWGTTDGGRGAGVWANAVPLGVRTPGPISANISGYAAGQVVYYRCMLSNVFGVKWSSKSVVIGPPTVQNELPYVRTNQTTLRSTVTQSNGLDVSSSIYWGTNDGGAVAANWQNVANLGVSSQSTVISNLSPGTRYYYRAYATNAAGAAWATNSFSFTTVGAPTFGEIWFFVGSDPHYGYTQQVPDTDTVSRGALDRMNSLPGQNFPPSAGGVVGIPRGVLVVGDITEGGNAAQWMNFTNDWGLNGERLLSYPLYEGYGNHDGGNGVVASSIKARNLSRTGVLPTNISANGYHYSWDWDFLHVVCLNLFPGDAAEVGFPGVNPQLAMQFLADDLARNVGSSGRPVIIYHHYGFESFGAGWWSPTQRANLYSVVTNYNIAAFINGHNHAITFTKWNEFDTYTDGTLGKSTGNFMAVRVTTNSLVAVERSPNNTWNTIYTKTITTPPLAPGLQVSNGSGATLVTMSSATLNGNLTSTNDIPTVTWFFWGTADGATNAAGWANSISIGPRGLGVFSTNVTGLALGTTYYYRAFASNATSQAWAGSTASFTTLSGEPLVQNAAASGITLSNANFNGNLISTGAAPTAVWLYWGTSDAGTNKGSWASVQSFGESGVGPLSFAATGLSFNTTYNYRYYASNAVGESWASPAMTFTTLNPLPVVSNTPATGITTNAATVNSSVISTGAASTSVYLHWGTNDGGMVKGNWAGVVSLGERGVGATATTLSGLLSSQTYFYRHLGSNSFGESWSPASSSFQTLGTGGGGGTWLWDDGGDGQTWASASNWSNVTTHLNNDSFPNGIGAVATNLTGIIVMNPTDVTVGELYCGSDFQLGLDVSPANTLTFDNGGAPAIWRINSTVAGNVYNNVKLLADLYITNTSTATLQVYRRNITGPGKDVYLRTTSSGGFIINCEDPATSYNTFRNLYLYTNSVFSVRETSRSPARSPLGTGTVFVEGGTVISVLLRVWATNNIALLGGSTKITYSEDRAQGVQLDGVISGAGRLVLEHNDTSAATGNFFIGGSQSNTFSGGLVVIGDNTGTANGTVVLRKNGAAGRGDVILTNEYARLQITDAGASDNRISDTAALRLHHVGVTYPKVVLDAGVNESVENLYFDNVLQAPGTWGATASAAANKNDNWFGGTGILNVTGTPVLFPPTITNREPSGITASSALLNGTLVSTGSAPTTVWVFWGTVDGGTNKAGWATNLSLGMQPVGEVSQEINGLLESTTYHYRFHASNAVDAAWSPVTTTFSTLNSDSDGDGIPDAWEIEKFGSLGEATATSDWDSDGMKDLDEYRAGTDPMDPGSKLAFTGLAFNGTGSTVLMWQSAAGKQYSVNQSTGFWGGAWLVIASNLLATPPVNTYTTAPLVAPALFYKISTP